MSSADVYSKKTFRGTTLDTLSLTLMQFIWLYQASIFLMNNRNISGYPTIFIHDSSNNQINSIPITL